MAGNSTMNADDLISELLQALTDDVQKLSQQVSKLPVHSPTDYRDNIEQLAQAVQELRQQAAEPTAATVDLSAITTQLTRIEQQNRQRPEYTMGHAVKIGAFAFGFMAILLGLMTYYGMSWKGERDRYEQAYDHDNWRVRYTEQANPDYYAYMEGIMEKDPIEVRKWILEQEQADQKRALAKKAAEQAKALSDQANELEGKTETKGNKKSSR